MPSIATLKRAGAATGTRRAQRCAALVEKLKALPEAQPFLVLPAKALFADYYRIVKRPTSLQVIRLNVCAPVSPPLSPPARPRPRPRGARACSAPPSRCVD